MTQRLEREPMQIMIYRKWKARNFYQGNKKREGMIKNKEIQKSIRQEDRQNIFRVT